jgi:uncharacterized protein YbjT (DUF2867 family)
MTTTHTKTPPLILVTGATGYIGARLVPRLLQPGPELEGPDLEGLGRPSRSQAYRVRVMVRDPRRLSGRPWQDQVEVVTGDVLQPDSLPSALAGVDAAYYLIHSMSGHADFHDRDRLAAANFSRAAQAAGVRQIIYLSGLGSESDENLSRHLQSRHETGQALRGQLDLEGLRRASRSEKAVPVTELRAAVIVGSGSLSFEMIRNLTERLPVMIVPRWAATRIQPIAIGDVIAYLVAAIDHPAALDRIIEIGGASVMTYSDMMKIYAREREMRRWLIPVPVLTPRLSSYWVHWVTPVPAAIARPLIEGLKNEVIVRDPSAAEIFPDIRPVDYTTAVRRALERLRDGHIESIWSDALSSSQGDRRPASFRLEQGMFIERRELEVAAPAADLFRTFTGLGGRRGWLAFDWAWRVRGLLDRLVGGVGLRRGRREPDELRVGDALDFWRVEAIEPGKLLRLRAEMKVPGRAWLQFEVEPLDDGRSRLIQTAYFASKGLGGLVYWYALYPVHRLIFGRMPRAIGQAAETQTLSS